MAVNSLDIWAHLCLSAVCAIIMWFAQSTLQDPESLDTAMEDLTITVTFLVAPLAFLASLLLVGTSEGISLKTWGEQYSSFTTALHKLAALEMEESLSFLNSLTECDRGILLDKRNY